MNDTTLPNSVGHKFVIEQDFPGIWRATVYTFKGDVKHVVYGSPAQGPAEVFTILVTLLNDQESSIGPAK